MRRLLLLIVLACAGCGSRTSEGLAAPGTFEPGPYYRLRTELFAAAPLSARDIVFLGDSLTEGGEWGDLFPHQRVRDRGISGDTAAGVLARLGQVTAARPRAIFLLIGTNDLAMDPGGRQSLANYRAILARIRHEAPATRVFVQSLLPRAARFRPAIESYNAALADLGREFGCTFIDLYPAFLAEDGSLRDEFTVDEVHLNTAGYLHWRELLQPHLASL